MQTIPKRVIEASSPQPPNKAQSTLFSARKSQVPTKCNSENWGPHFEIPSFTEEYKIQMVFIHDDDDKDNSSN